MNGSNSDNAARRATFAGETYLAGVRTRQRAVLDTISPRFRELHECGAMHLHDLEGYGSAPNCLAPNWAAHVETGRVRSASRMQRAAFPFDVLRQLITDLGNEQTGGIGFVDFDAEIAGLLSHLGLAEADEEYVQAALLSFLEWINVTRTRYGLECYYVTLNLGTCCLPLGRAVSRLVLGYLKDRPWENVRPNVVFKVVSGVNAEPGTPNYDLLVLAQSVCAQRMVPTFLLCHAAPNRTTPPEDLAIMGCRTRVVANRFGAASSQGRGNIAYATLNLPRIAANARGEVTGSGLHHLAQEMNCLVEQTVASLVDRLQRLSALPADRFPGNRRWDPWCVPFADSDGSVAAWRQGTLAVGFVGLAEAVEESTGLSFADGAEGWRWGQELIEILRDSVDRQRERHDVNLTLLATSAEHVAGRFAALDVASGIRSAVKGYYTNSFHVPVDYMVHPLRKLELEAPFHSLCNGGCISYVELAGAPLGNRAAISELIEFGASAGISYLGVNFPVDRCRSCGRVGVFDACVCGSRDILRVRRVSGYLEDLDHFTAGKQAEVAKRRCFPEFGEGSGDGNRGTGR